jgi:predicted nuclease with TOPRIM domain
MNILYRVSADRFNALDASLEGLIKSYKCMQPRIEADSQETAEEIQQKFNHLRDENESLRDELSTANGKLGDLITEFGEIFGGGQDHQLTLQEVINKVDTMKADHESGTPSRAQK